MTLFHSLPAPLYSWLTLKLFSYATFPPQPSRLLLSEPANCLCSSSICFAWACATANEVNTTLRAVMRWLGTIGRQNNLCAFLDSGRRIVSGAFGWWDNCFQSSLWSNCASFHPCPPLCESAAHRWALSQRDVEEQQRFGWSD